MPRPDISQAVADRATAMPYPDGKPGRFLELPAVAALAREYGLSPKAVEQAALAADICPLRYARNLRAFSLAEQAKLLASGVAMVGLGGLGGGLLEILVRGGVGTVRGADGDRFEESNLNRQLLADMSALGETKARQAAKRAAAVNPSVDFQAHEGFLDAAGMLAFLDGMDVAVDALGGLKDRPALTAAARTHHIPLVTAAVAGYTVIVATVMPGEPSPVEMLAGNATGPSAEEVLGCPSPAVMAAAALQGTEVLRLLAGHKPALAGKGLIIDLETMRFDTVDFTATK